jgi:hypothetical protein
VLSKLLMAKDNVVPMIFVNFVLISKGINVISYEVV